MQAHFSISTIVLALGGVIPAASDDATRPLMNGVLVRVEGDVATFVATDGHMLATYTATRVRDERAPCDSGDAFLPLATAKALLRAAKEAARQLSVTGAEQYVVTIDTDANEARAPGGAFAMPAYDGGFPPYEQVLPKYLDEPRAATGGGAAFVGLGMKLLATVAACFKGADGGNATVIPGTGELDPVLFLGQRDTTRGYDRKARFAKPCPLTVVLMPCRIRDAGAPDPFARARERAALLAAGCPKLAEVFAPAPN